MNAFLSVLFLLVAGAGCSGSAKAHFHGDALKIDERYVQVIEFTALDMRVPLGRNAYVRVDAPVTNTLEHLHLVLRELGVTGKRAFFSNPAENGMQVHLRFRDGKQCSFIWVRRNADSRLVKASLEHEKYHAVCRLKPEAIDAISARISELGFNLNLADFDEEFAATVIQMLTLHREGIPLEELHGSESVVKAVGVLKASLIVPNERGAANGSGPIRSRTNSTSSADGSRR
jgi:hypothetical protein